ncbi:hypothetical protein Q7C36_017345 [Tachysurus vachellii]|uniref:Uncharacterized protein n=1 Tax=Tachysurus vachellii TaxID=175792 RepID=A0AA88M4A3_TACVA|nr:hypothetical protein Q7C36_017345 [Tachysurus vachellii]
MTSALRRSCKNTRVSRVERRFNEVNGTSTAAKRAFFTTETFPLQPALLFLCLASADPCIVQGLIPREISSSFWKY